MSRYGAKAKEVATPRRQQLWRAAGGERAEGGTAIGTEEPKVRQSTIASREGVYPKEMDWRTLSENGEMIAAE